MENANGNIAALHQAEIDAKAHYDALAQRLSEVRTQAALTLSKAVSIQMQTLSMPGGQFEATLIKLPEGGAHGYEEVEFRVAGHPGVPLRPLAKVASGGELSRISLALCVVTHGAGLTPTLIFDEVDSGIGGAAAEAVGDRLKQLAIDHQVLCVTHLPRVAACGESHFRITKHTSAENQTYSIVIPLNPDERTEEIARMLGGREITQTTREHAKEMVASACGKSKS
jgi:DNA repair protein RecN (Recombination protein N)